MKTYKGLIRAVARAERASARKKQAQHKAQAQMQTQAAKAAEKARKDFERSNAANQKEQARLYVESRLAQVALQNEQLEQQIQTLENILLESLSTDPYINLQTLKEYAKIPPFNPGALGIAEPAPQWSAFQPHEPTGVRKLFPGATERFAQEMTKAQQMFREQVALHAAREAHRLQSLASLKMRYDEQTHAEQQRIIAQHRDVDTFQQELSGGSPQAVVDYFSMVLDANLYPEDFPQKAKLAYVPESKQLVIEFDFPTFDAIPDIGSYKYVKTKDVITVTVRSQAQRKVLYSSVLAQITLRTLSEVFRADRMKCLDVVIFNGYAENIHKGTGQTVRTCLITVRTSRDVFSGLNLKQVDPGACLAELNASVSKSPTELTPVRPVLEFSMVDPRFIEETDVLSDLDQRPNLMELSPSEFESLISNVFGKMGLETRQTQASRDGGVDCIAYDTRAILGGKIVIQAKRYKGTVGVSAVRDLYGTVMNEGASKGILVTTSGYGTASYKFAENKPLELLSGSNLLYLLKEYAGIEAKIEPPKDWKDPQQDG